MTALRVLYVHGLHGKPPEPEYRAAWDAALRRTACGGNPATNAQPPRR